MPRDPVCRPFCRPRGRHLGGLGAEDLRSAGRWEPVVASRLDRYYPDCDVDRVLTELRWISRVAETRDIIVGYQGERVLGLAEITSPYVNAGEAEFPHAGPSARCGRSSPPFLVVCRQRDAPLLSRQRRASSLPWRRLLPGPVDIEAHGFDGPRKDRPGS